MQALKFEALDAAGISMTVATVSALWVANCGRRRVAQRQHLSRAGDVVEIGHRLAREHRIIGKAALLRALDLGVPIGALDEPQRQSAAMPRASAADPVDHRHRALLIGLDGEPETVPAAQRWIARATAAITSSESSSRSASSASMVNCRSCALRDPREIDHARRQLGENARARQGLETRMQRGEFDRNPGRAGRGGGGRSADRLDRMRIGVEILRGVGRGAGAFAEHVEGIA